MWLTVLCVADGSGTYFMEVDRVSILHKAIKLGRNKPRKMWVQNHVKPQQQQAAAVANECSLFRERVIGVVLALRWRGLLCSAAGVLWGSKESRGKTEKKGTSVSCTRPLAFFYCRLFTNVIH